jgi:hypothetical protein
MLYLGIALMFATSLTAIALWWRDHSRWLDAEARANDLAASGAQALEAANQWREAYFGIKSRLQPPALTVFQPMYHAPKGIDD